ncbi:MAG: hypothetical protein LBC70_08025 [Chitinispirillales bacterium]|jgi:hypothetical protein|nr:hypothetical protein [Chitinispirillales bacterium]
MIYEQPLFFFDATAVAMMLVLAYLSKRLGAAMHIRPYYIVFFVTSIAIVAASGLETIPAPLSFSFIPILTNSIRFAAAAAAFAVALRYWKWLFVEFSRK